MTMPHWQLIYTLLLFVGQLIIASAFLPNELSPYISGEDYTQASITEIGILLAAEDYLQTRNISVHSEQYQFGHRGRIKETSSRKLFDKYFGEDASDRRIKDVIQDIIRHNNYVDRDFSHDASWHFNAEQIGEGHNKMQTLRTQILQMLSQKSPDYLTIREHLGKYLHLLQSFYSNTNWIEVHGHELCKSLGIAGKYIIPTARKGMDTCTSCGVSEGCLGNILVTDFLTSGYKTGQNIEKPQKSPQNSTTGKCSHGGPGDVAATSVAALGGINKETGNPLYSPHFYLHSNAAEAAIEHTRMFFTDNETGLMSLTDRKKIEELLGLTRGHTYVFAIDPTNMVAHQAVSIVKDLLMTLSSSGSGRNKYVIVMTGSKESIVNTHSSRNISEILRILDSIDINIRRQCKQLPIRVIEEALNQADLHSKLYVFMDKEPTDVNKNQHLTNLVKEKKIVMEIIQEEKCNSAEKGAVFEPEFSTNGLRYRQMTKRSDFLVMSAARNVCVLHKEINKTQNGGNQFPVDTMIRQLNITIKTSKDGALPVVRLPSGNYLPVKEHLEQSEGTFHLKIERPLPGVWYIYKTHDDHWSLDIAGLSPLDVKCTFVYTDSSSHVQYKSSYLENSGNDQEVIVEMSTSKLVGQSLKLLVQDKRGEIIDERSLEKIIINGHKVYKTSLKGLNETSGLAVEGKDRSGKPFRRMCSKQHPGHSHSRQKRALSTWSIPSAFSQISTITGGHVYQSGTGNNANAQSILQGSLNFQDVMILRLKFPGGAGGFNSVKIPIDDTITQFTVTIDGITGRPPYQLLNPNGNKINFIGQPQNTSLTFIGNTVIQLVIKDPEPGGWSLIRSDDKSWNLQVTGQSSLEFTTKLMKTSSNGYTQYEIPGRPVIGETLSSVITVSDESKINTVDTLFLLDENGQEIARYKLKTTNGGKVHGVYHSDIVVPDKKFQIAVEGFDKGGQEYRRHDTAMMTPVAVDLTILPLPGPFYTNENLEVTYVVKNTGPGTMDISVKITDDQGFSLNPTEKSHTLAAGANATDKFLIHARNTKDIVTTVTVSAQPVTVSGGNFQYDVVRTITVDRVNKPTDNKDPVCTLGTVTGTCTKVCGCETEFIEADTESSDEGFGIYTVTANHAGKNSVFTPATFTPGITKSQGTVKAHLKVDCCRKHAYVTVTDFDSRSTQCKIPVNSQWTAIGCTTTLSTSTTTSTTTTTTPKSTTSTTSKSTTTTTGKATTTTASEESSTWLTTPAKIGIATGAGVLSIAAITTCIILIKKKYSSVSPD